MIFFSKDLGVDLGTANVLIYQEGKGIVLREPSVVAVDKLTGKVLQVGSAARNMLGRTPGNVVAMRPMREGVISDYEMTEKMLAEFFRKIMRYSILKPRVIVSVPSGVTGVEERAVIQAAQEAGARRVYLIEEPLAAALGAHMDISGPEGHMIVDIGGGTTDIAVLTLNGVAVSSSIKTAGDTFDDIIIRYVRRKYGAIIGTNTAEEIKMSVGCVIGRLENPEIEIRARDLKTGLTKDVVICSDEMLEILRRPAKAIADEVLSVLEQATPELVADISRNGIVLSGGGSQIWGMDRFLQERTEIPCTIADDPDSCVAYGCGKSLEWLGHMQEGTINIARRRLMKE